MLIKEFQEYIKIELLKKLNNDYEIDHYNTKNNYVLIVRKKDSIIKSVIYIQEYFKLYTKGNSLENIFLDIVEKIVFKEKMQRELKFNLTNYEQVKKSLFFRLINTSENIELLQYVPHIPFLDLNIVFYLEISNLGTILIENSLVTILKTSKEQLYKDALNNLQNLKPCRFMDLYNFALKKETTFPEKLEFVIMTNSSHNYGAACILYTDILKKIAEREKKDILILPSSIHEVILMPDSKNIDIQRLAEMVYEVNTQEVFPLERLSFHIYRYSIQNDKISIAY